MITFIHVGVSPAGVKWNVYLRDGETLEALAERADFQRTRLAALHAKARPTLTDLRLAYQAARKRYLFWRGRVNSNAFRARSEGGQKAWRDQHQAASDRLAKARKALRKAEKKCQ
jgi:hypothetical protein